MVNQTDLNQPKWGGEPGETLSNCWGRFGESLVAVTIGFNSIWEVVYGLSRSLDAIDVRT